MTEILLQSPFGRGDSSLYSGFSDSCGESVEKNSVTYRYGSILTHCYVVCRFRFTYHQKSVIDRRAPQVANCYLRAGRDAVYLLAQFCLPYEDPKEKFGLKPPKTQDQRNAEDQEAAETYNTLFREYIIQYASFRRVAVPFLITLLLMITTAALQASSVWQRVLLILTVNSVALLAAAYLKPTIAPHPEDLLSIDYIGRQFANLKVLAEAIEQVAITWQRTYHDALQFV